jgi:hypothetical protein
MKERESEWRRAEERVRERERRREREKESRMERGKKEKEKMMGRGGEWGIEGRQESGGVGQSCNLEEIGPILEVKVHWLCVQVVAEDDNVAIDILLFVHIMGQLVLILLFHQLLLLLALFTVGGLTSATVWD